MPTPEQWSRIKELFTAALERSPADRAAYLDRECASDQELRAEVESLLEAHEQSDGLSQHPDVAPLLDAIQQTASFGPYRLLRLLGRGGMGQVWLAEQRSPIRRQVAIKFLPPGVLNEASKQRFALERQSLALMEHPNIAKVFDAGTDPVGRPYFAMEYVPGIPITDFCDRHKLTVTERLRLFQQVCDGVQHAHLKSIVHRDLKPSNILVTDVSGKPAPRIIDFGIAKSISPGSIEDHTVFTLFGTLVGTPGFMSPEQLTPEGTDIDTRTDVYSLGVLLYVLLTGFMPFAHCEAQKRPLDEILRELREKDPPIPSTRIANIEGTTSDSSELRSTQPRQLVSTLRGDLDWITMKALEKDRERRYASPADFAADIQRFLENRPVLARPASTAYRVRKYVSRNRLLVTASAIAFAMLIAFIGVLAMQLRRTTRERDRANRITDFMTKMFEVADPHTSRGNSITVREILDKSSKDIETGLNNEPQLQAQLMGTMGEVYRKLGLFPQAESLLRRAMDSERRLLGAENPETASTTSRLAATLADEGELPEAEALLRPLVEIEKRVFGPEHQKTLLAMNLLATSLHAQGKFPDAEKMYRQTLEIQKRVYGPDDPATLTMMSNIGALLSDEGSRSEEMVALDREVLERRERVLGSDHPDTLRSMSNLGIVLTTLNRTAEAEALLNETLRIQLRVLGPDHPDTLGTVSQITTVLEEEFRYPEEEAMLRKNWEAQKHVLGPEHRDTMSTMINLAGVLGLQRQYPEAERISRDAIAIEMRAFGPESAYTLQTKLNLADMLESQRKLREAEMLATEVLEIATRVAGPESSLVLQAQFTLANTAKDQGRLAEAEAAMRKVRDGSARIFGPEHPRVAQCTEALARNAALQGKYDESLQLLREALDHGLDPPTAQAIAAEPDYKSLGANPRFQALVAEIRQKYPAAAFPKHA